MAHTPGPWTTAPCSAGGLLVKRGEWGQSVQIVPEEDARLIAAAPDLLEELKELVELFSGYQGMELKRAKAAIARAQGEE